MEIQKINYTRTIFFVITAMAAIVIFSSTIGKDWYEGREQTIESFAVVHFAGYLFFLLMPVELAFGYCALGFSSPALIIAIALGTALSAQLIDYFIGYFIHPNVIFKYIGNNKTDKARVYIQKYGNLTIFIFNLFPLSSPIVCLTAGILKYPFKKVLFYSLTGLMLKYISIAVFIEVFLK